MYDGTYDPDESTVTFHDDFPNDMVCEVSIRLSKPIKRKELTTAVMVGMHTVEPNIFLNFAADWECRGRFYRFWESLKSTFSELLRR
jgi:hypothetical protein